MSAYGPEPHPALLALVLAATPLAWIGLGFIGWAVTR